jgi:hypothetical protein
MNKRTFNYLYMINGSAFGYLTPLTEKEIELLNAELVWSNKELNLNIMNETIKKLSDLSNVKVGDTIWTVQDGETKVISVKNGKYHPIKTVDAIYTIDGKFLVNDQFPSAFLKNPFESQERWVEVRDDEEEEWVRKKLIMEKNGKFICWRNAKTDEEVEESLNTTTWYYMREIEEPKQIEITLDEIAEKFGVSVEQLKIKK